MDETCAVAGYESRDMADAKAKGFRDAIERAVAELKKGIEAGETTRSLLHRVEKLQEVE